MRVSPSDIEAYLRQLAEARAAVDRLDEPDKALGLAALRLEAAQLHRHLLTTGAPDAAVLQPLQKHVAALVGGERVEVALGAIESQVTTQATQAVTQIGLAAVTGHTVFSGVVGVVFTYLALFTDVAVRAGGNVATILMSGALPGAAVVLVLRGAGPSASAAQGTWTWASSLATTADRALAPSRELGRRLWASAGGSAAPPGSTVTARARRVAMGLVGTAAGLLGLGVLAFGYGVIQGLPS